MSSTISSYFPSGPSSSIEPQQSASQITPHSSKANVNYSAIADQFFWSNKEGTKKCNVEGCGAILKLNKTTKANLKTHVEKKHPIKWAEAINIARTLADGKTITQFTTNATNDSIFHKEGTKYRQSKLNEAIIQLIIMAQLPYLIVQYPEFVKMIQGEFFWKF